ncbi:MAG TPA: hypothetical protein DCY94_00420 [Firmicutes bacterium]|nr:hypothetical protein [Bacillota bacterium]
MEHKDKYKKLELRRDLCKFILDLRIANYLTNNDYKSEIPVKGFSQYIEQYSDMEGRLDSLLERSRLLGLNPNVLHYYDDELLTEETKKDDSIRELDREINTLLWCFRDATTLCAELIKIYEYGRNQHSPISQQKLISTICYLAENFGVYEKGSVEERFLTSMTAIANRQFDAAFLAYFDMSRMTEEERTSVVGAFIREMYHNHNEAAVLFDKLLKKYGDFIRLSKEDLVLLIEGSSNRSAEFLSVFDTLWKSKNPLPISALEYMDLLFNEYINEISVLEQYRKIVAYLSIQTCDEKLKHAILPLLWLSGIDSKEF